MLHLPYIIDSPKSGGVSKTRLKPVQCGMTTEEFYHKKPWLSIFLDAYLLISNNNLKLNLNEKAELNKLRQQTLTD
jgi:hypothetical protein